MTKVIACAHEKGGVGKTTTTVNLGVGLARQGKNVLLLDADPQGDLSKCLGVKNPRELTNTISTVMDYLIAHSDEDTYPDFEYTAPIRQHTEGIDFIPANASLAATEVTLVNSMSRETILRQYLDMVKDKYDYVLIDCRPSLGLTVVNALTAADSVIIPVQAHILAADDMDALFKTIGRVKRNLNPRLQVDGIVMTMVDSRTNLSRNTIRAVRDAYGSLVRVFKSEIPFAIRAAEVPEKGQSIYAYDPNGRVAKAYEALTKEGSGEQIQEIALSQLHEFADHPFHVTDDQSLRDMAESIRTYGQLTPALVRPLEDKPGEYELVSGNRRHRACRMAGLTHMKVIVKEMTRDEAIIQMVDANLQRESLFPSERAFAYKMKLEAIRRQAGRPSKDNSRQVVGNLESADIVGKNSGESGRQVQRYIRLTELIQPLLTMVDDRKIALNPAVELSYLSHEQQTDLLDLMEAYDSTPSLAQAQRLKQAAKEGILDKNGIDLVMREEKPNQKEVFKLPRERLAKYFTPDTPLHKMEETIVKALDFYYKKLERDRQAKEYSR